MTEIKPTLYLNMIVKEDEDPQIVKRSINSVKPYVDGMYITVTYSEKPPYDSKLTKALKKLGANVSFFQWVDDFSAARQFAMDQMPKGEHTYMYWQDADDILLNAEKLPEVAQDADLNNWSAVFFTYLYQCQLNDKLEVEEVFIEHKRERVVRNDGTWQWQAPLHEVLVEQKKENLNRVYRDDCKVLHITSTERMDKNIERNRRILEKIVAKEHHKDPRNVLYLAKTYIDLAKMQQDEGQQKIFYNLSLQLLHEYLNGSGTPGDPNYIEPSGWSEERTTAYESVAEVAIATNAPKAAISAFHSAIEESPEFPNLYINLAATYALIGDFAKAKHWLNLGSHVTMPNTTIITFPYDIKTRALETAYHVHMHEGKLEKAEKDCEMLLEIVPYNKEVQERQDRVKKLIEFNKACQSVVYYGKYLESTGEVDKLPHLVQSLSNDMQQEKFASEMRHRFLPSRKWNDNEVAILCGPGFEQWSPKSIKTGIGGSEEAVIHMSRELTKLGWRVTVYANPQQDAGMHDGVEWKPWHEWNPQDEFNILVLWRSIGIADLPLKAKFTMVWLHDIPNNPDFTETRVNKVNKIAVLSEYHKSLLRLNKNGEFATMPEEKIFLTANGIPKINIQGWNGNPHAMIYSSSPDRGLIYLLNNWADIRLLVPDAELHVAYGFKVFDAIFADNPAKQAWKDQVMQAMKQPGITYHDRLGHQELHELMNKCGIWAYPTHFEEISCITAMKAQRLGAVPVVANLAALDETVKNGLKVDVDITTKEGQQEYFIQLNGLLRDEAKQAEIRKGMMEWADSYFSWANVARGWSELFHANLPINQTIKE